MMTYDRAEIRPERLMLALRALRPREREALALSTREGLSNGEIALRLGITPRAAERLLAKALHKLDRSLERQERPWWRIW